ncbi:MAG: PSP1 domain-containing protein [Candidatus Bipolaricaulaceae bacterium]
MAEERLKALVRRFSPLPDVHLAVWGAMVGRTGQRWVEDDGRGLWQVQVLRSPVRNGEEPQGTLLRPAGEGDEQRFQGRREETETLTQRAQQAAAALELPMQFITGEMDLERRFLRLFFTAPGRVDFRELLRQLSRQFQMKIELRQVGPRDEARLLGGVGPCGRPLCCRTFLHQLRPIPLELAFDQQLFFSPERITGLCGRLMCCLAYEHAQYLEALEGVPKVGEKVHLHGRSGEVVGVNIFRGTVHVAWNDGGRAEIPCQEFKERQRKADREDGPDTA